MNSNKYYKYSNIFREKCAEVFITNQIAEYQRHAIKNQRNSAHCNTSASFRAKRLSPETMNPKPLQTSNRLLMENFKHNYNRLFFQHLERVTESNTISLELHTASSKSISHAEQYLAAPQLTLEEVTETYQRFTSQIEIRDHVPIPALQMKLK